MLSNSKYYNYETYRNVYGSIQCHWSCWNYTLNSILHMRMHQVM